MRIARYAPSAISLHFPETVDTMWGTDMTATMTLDEGQVAVFIAIDHCSAECVGIHAARRGTRFEALEPVRQGVRERFGAVGQDITVGLSIRHDHGSQYMARDFQTEIRCGLGRSTVLGLGVAGDREGFSPPADHPMGHAVPVPPPRT